MMRFLVVVYVAALMLTACGGGGGGDGERPAPAPDVTGEAAEKAAEMSKERDAAL